MFPRKSAFGLGLFLASASLLLPQDNQNASQKAGQTAKKALDLLLSQKFPELSAMFSDTLKQSVTLDFLQQRVSAELKEFGPAQNIGEAILAVEGTNHLVSYPIRFSNASIHVQFTLDRYGQVAGMYFRPANKPFPAMWKQPSYSKPQSFHDRELTIGANTGDDKWKLGGTLSSPVGTTRVPGIVLVHGPGPSDRNETVFATRIFEDLAEGLASRGYAVLRYDKRTKVYGEEMSKSGYTLEEETVEDAVRAAALLRKQPEVDPSRIYVLGHSLGGYASPRIAARDRRLSGLILLAGLARPVEDAALDQSEYLMHLKADPSPNEENRLKQFKAEIDKVKKLAPGANNPPILLGLPTAWLLNVKGYDPCKEAKGLEIPVLVLQGERDFQVTMKDFALWKTGLSGRDNIAFHSYPALNHLFIAGEGKSSPAEYHNSGNVAAEVVDDISRWLAGQKH